MFLTGVQLRCTGYLVAKSVDVVSGGGNERSTVEYQEVRTVT